MPTTTPPRLPLSHHLVAGYRQEWASSLVFSADIYYQHLFRVPVDSRAGSTFSSLNAIEAFRQEAILLSSTGAGRNYGLDLLLQKFIRRGYYFSASGSLYRSLYTAVDGVERPSRFDGRYLANLTFGREFLKQKPEKSIIRGLSARFIYMGGFRTSPVDVPSSMTKGYTVYDETRAFSLKQEDYLRLDLRLYIKWNKLNRNNMLSLDLQNATNRKNAQYDYFDIVQARVLTKKQLGLIPILNWRMAF